MIDETYQCVQYNEYVFEFGKKYRIIRESEIYLPNSESLDIIDVIVFEKDMWIPKYDFNRVFKKLDYLRSDKIDSILR
jgi:hypothetical protein